MSYQAFAIAIDRFIEEDVPDEIVKLTRLISIAALNKVVLKSPVDTGRFRGAWHVTIAERSDAVPAASSVKAGSRGRSARAASSGTSAITEGVGVIGGAQPYQSIVIQNNVEYAEDLEDGGSDQAPRGILAVSVAELEVIFR